jgi:hypothetical protein
MSKPLQLLREALYSTGLVQPLDGGGRGGSIHLLCRQVSGQEQGWIQAIDRILALAETMGFETHLCRRYVRKDGKLAFGWFISVEAKSAKELTGAVEALVQTLRSTPVAKPRVQAPKAAVIRKMTGADPREPSDDLEDPVPPPDLKISLKKTRDGQEEMPLPHVYGDINRPKPGSNKGAASLLNNSELFKGIKNG